MVHKTSLDGTVHEIERPMSVSQRPFYNAHHHHHALYNQRQIYYIHSGFLGSQNDAGQFLQLPEIGFHPTSPLPFPRECYLLSDKGYANRYPIITPYKAQQFQAATQQRLKMKIINTEHARVRVHEGHSMRHIKTYRAVGLIYRHPRNIMPLVTEVCWFLAHRNKDLISRLHY